MDMEFVNSLFPSDAERRQNYTAEQEKFARQRGFKNANEMILWEAQRSKPRSQQTVAGAESKKPADDKSKSSSNNGGGGGNPLDFISRIMDAFHGALK